MPDMERVLQSDILDLERIIAADEAVLSWKSHRTNEASCGKRSETLGAKSNA
jgi:hypothetical protein